MLGGKKGDREIDLSLSAFSSLRIPTLIKSESKTLSYKGYTEESPTYREEH